MMEIKPRLQLRKRRPKEVLKSIRASDVVMRAPRKPNPWRGPRLVWADGKRVG
jgi:hypothetical protein